MLCLQQVRFMLIKFACPGKSFMLGIINLQSCNITEFQPIKIEQCKITHYTKSFII